MSYRSSAQRPAGMDYMAICFAVMFMFAGSRAVHAQVTLNAQAGGAPPGNGKSWTVTRMETPFNNPRARMPRRLVLKLRPAAAESCLSCALARKEKLGQVVSGSRLDELNRRFGAHAARPLLQAHAHMLVPEPRAKAAMRQQEVASRFAVRQARAPRAASVPEFSSVYVVELRRRSDLETVAQAYAADPAVEYCEPDRVVETTFAANDPYLSSSGSWGQDYDDLWGVKKIQAPTAWDSTRGTGVTVAVVDTGIDYTHPDIAANVWTNTGEIPNNGIDDDGNGYVDDVYGWNFAGAMSDPMDDMFHGTHVAGTIAATGNNALGVIGIAFGSRVMAVKGLSHDGTGTVSDLAQAVIYAVDNGADVINASWAGSGHSQLIADAIAYAHAHGVVFVAAAGNSSMDTDGFFPANDPNAITVAATTHLDEQAGFSNFGLKLDVAAPGGGDGPPPSVTSVPLYSVLSLLSSAADPSWYSALRSFSVGDRYLRLAGTSMAAPHVAGTAALVLAAHPSWTVEEIRQTLRSTADDLGAPGTDPTFGYGRVNAARAAAAPEPLAAYISSPTRTTLIGQTTIPILGSAAGPGFTSYTLEYGAAPVAASWTPIVTAATVAVDGGVLANWNVTEIPDGNYVIRLRVARTAQEFSDATVVTLRNIAIDAPPRLAAFRPDSPIEIRGTAAGAGFVSYKVEYLRGQDPLTWRSTGITLAGSPNTPVRNGLLATFDPGVMSAGDQFNFRLTVTNGAGTQTRTRGGIVIDPTLRSGWPQSLVPVADQNYLTVADLDGDGRKEILVGSGDEIVIFEPDGSVRPGWPQTLVTPGNTAPYVQGSPIVADINGDGALEVITTDFRRVFAWSANGVLLPGFPRHVQAFDDVINASVTAADLNGDGADEILCSGIYRTQAFFGDGTEVPGWDATFKFQPAPWGPMAVGDVFGDGHVYASLYGLYFRPNTPNIIGARVDLLNSSRNAIADSRLPWTGGFVDPAMADLDGDGLLDQIVISEPRRRVGIRGPVTALAWSPTGAKIPMSKYRRPALPEGNKRTKYQTNGLFSFADLDGDGQAEAYVYTITPVQLGYAHWLGQFAEFRAVQSPALSPIQRPVQRLPLHGGAITSIAIADIDGDGQQELVAGISGFADMPGIGYDNLARLAVVAAKKDGTLLPQFPKPVPHWITEPGDDAGYFIQSFADDSRFGSPAIADLDGDGLKELIWVDTETNLLMVWNIAGTPGPERADWPMYRHDPKHTNVLPVRR